MRPPKIISSYLSAVLSRNSLHSYQSKRCLSSSSALHSVGARRYVPRRAVLYVPGNDERKLAKIPSLGADCIVLDCEDGVALSKKAAARSTIRRVLDHREIDFTGKDCSVRLNSIDSGLFNQDIEEVLSGEHLPDTVHLPKVESPEHLDEFSAKLKSVLGSRDVDVRLVVFTESAQSLLSLPAILARGHHLSTTAPFTLDAVVFGSDDFCADIGATRTNEARELTYARQRVVAVAKAFKLQAIDLVYIDYKDLGGLQRQCEEGAQWGFTGKQVIHPGQVDIVQAAFTPSAARREWATELIREFEQHQREGKGAFTFRGNMIDMPLVLQARNILHTT